MKLLGLNLFCLELSVWLQKTALNTRHVVESHTKFKMILNNYYATKLLRYFPHSLYPQMQFWILLSLCSSRLAISPTCPASQKHFRFSLALLRRIYEMVYTCQRMTMCNEVSIIIKRPKEVNDNTCCSLWNSTFCLPLALKTKEVDKKLCNT